MAVFISAPSGLRSLHHCSSLPSVGPWTNKDARPVPLVQLSLVLLETRLRLSPPPPPPPRTYPCSPRPSCEPFFITFLFFMLAQTLRIEHVLQGLSPRPDMDSLSTAAPPLQVCSPSRRFCLFPRWNFLPRYPLGAGLLSVIVLKARAPRRQNSASSLLSPVTTGLMNPLIKHD